MLAFVKFHVLGPLRVEDEGEPYELGGPKQRAVLAHLLVEAGSPVSTDALIMDVYGADADPGARRSLQTYVSSLRRTFGNVINHKNQAYTLNVDPASVDAVRFERTIRRARATADESVSADMLREALGMWRGAPYSGVNDSESLRSETMRLEGLHAEALETRIELDLVAGRHRELLAELTDLASTYPLRESLRAHQMLALYRCGRQADALRAYRQTQSFLRTELGLDPSTGLQTLEARILQQDPALDYRPRPRLRPAPARYTGFFGRSVEIEAVRELLVEHRLVTITGTGGIGKSSLAAAVTRTLSESMTTAFVPVDTSPKPDIMALILASLGIRVEDESSRLGAICDVLSAKPTILLLDGCEQIIDELPGPISEILSTSPSTRILMTSREGLFMPGERRYLLGPLGQGEGSASNTLFENRAGIYRSELDEESLAMVSDIGTHLSGIPLAIELAAARHRTVSLHDMVHQLDRQADLLSRTRGPLERHLSMTAALDWSYDLLDPTAQLAFRRLAVFRQGIPSEAAAAVLESDEPSASLRALADASLVVPPDEDAGFRMLEPVRQYAWMHLERSGELDSVLLRHTEWVVDLCGRIRRESTSGNTSTALSMISAHGPEVEASARWALESDRPAMAMAIVAAVGRQRGLVFDPQHLQETGRRAIDHGKAPTGDLAVRAVAQTALMAMEVDRETAMSLVGRLNLAGDRTTNPETLFDVSRARAVVPHNVAPHHLDQEQMLAILATWDQAIEHAATLSWPVEPHLYNRALFLQDLGRHDEAKAALTELLVWADESRPLERGRALHALARIETFRGAFGAAIDMATEAARLLVDANDLNFAAEAQYHRAAALYLSNRPQDALVSLDMVDQYHRLIGLPPAADEDPALAAAITAGLGYWERFATLMGRWIDQAPPSDNEADRELFLAGDASMTTHIGLLMYPTARWLASTGRTHEAARIVAGTPMAFDAMGFCGWEDIGETERFAALALELDDVPPGDPLSTLDEMYEYIAGSIRDTPGRA